MVNFAELKAKAERAKDASVTKVTNTRDRYSSVPGSKVNWDPNWKRAPPSSATSRASTPNDPPPPPLRPSHEVLASDVDAAVPPVVPRASRPTDSGDLAAYTPRPPPTRATSGYPPSSRRDVPQDAVSGIDWTNLSAEDKEVFFGWLDEFFSRYLGIELAPRVRRPAGPSNVPRMLGVHRALHTASGPPPTVNMATRPQV